ncbi:MAG: decarboxylating NADP(+)-dependent phosphogluconate dehydrogenase [Granulosicoccaceae bacterium]
MSNQTPCDIGLIGLAVMGQNLILNMNDRGYRVAAYNRTASKTTEFLDGEAKGTQIVGAESLQALVSQLTTPRRIMLMVKAGKAVDAVIEQLLPQLSDNDIIIDGGNSNYEDTQRRSLALQKQNIRFVGMGVSGGEEGARHGPSLMPGGDVKAWPDIKELFQAIAAKTEQGEPCCEWVGKNGAGHFVKMVHNGIEYGDMQLICECYHFMKSALGMSNDVMHEVFADWNKGPLNSYLIEITADILAHKTDGTHTIDRILDKAGQKGTGKWTAINALDFGVPLPLITEAVFSRFLSSLKSERIDAATKLKGPNQFTANATVDDLEQALLASRLISYAQGFVLIQQAAEQFEWEIDLAAVAQLWRAGCIIRSAFLTDIRAAFKNKPQLQNLLLDDHFITLIETAQPAWRKTTCDALMGGVPVPALASALCYYDGYRTATLPANLLQAQRDYFGAHTYQLLEGGDQTYHTQWQD